MCACYHEQKPLIDCELPVILPIEGCRERPRKRIESGIHAANATPKYPIVDYRLHVGRVFKSDHLRRSTDRQSEECAAADR